MQPECYARLAKRLQEFASFTMEYDLGGKACFNFHEGLMQWTVTTGYMCFIFDQFEPLEEEPTEMVLKLEGRFVGHIQTNWLKEVEE